MIFFILFILRRLPIIRIFMTVISWALTSRDPGKTCIKVHCIVPSNQHLLSSLILPLLSSAPNQILHDSPLLKIDHGQKNGSPAMHPPQSKLITANDQSTRPYLTMHQNADPCYHSCWHIPPSLRFSLCRIYCSLGFRGLLVLQFPFRFGSKPMSSMTAPWEMTCSYRPYAFRATTQVVA